MMCPRSEAVITAPFHGVITSSNLVEDANGMVAQLVRALPCHGRGCGFESRPFRHNRGVAQLVRAPL